MKKLVLKNFHRFDVSATAMPVELARALGRLPRRCIIYIYALEGASFEPGGPLSPPVAAAAAKVARGCAPRLPGMPGVNPTQSRAAHVVAV